MKSNGYAMGVRVDLGAIRIWRNYKNRNYPLVLADGKYIADGVTALYKYIRFYLNSRQRTPVVDLTCTALAKYMVWIRCFYQVHKRTMRTLDTYFGWLIFCRIYQKCLPPIKIKNILGFQWSRRYALRTAFTTMTQVPGTLPKASPRPWKTLKSSLTPHRIQLNTKKQIDVLSYFTIRCNVWRQILLEKEWGFSIAVLGKTAQTSPNIQNKRSCSS